MTLSDEGTITSIAEKISKGECILFLGAGVHYPPPDGSEYTYPENERPPLGSSLSEYLAKRIDLLQKYPKEQKNTSNLQRVSLYYEKEKSRRALVEEIRKAVSIDKKPSPLVRALAQLDFPLVITTNYDQLFETAMREVGKRPRMGIYNSDGNTQTTDYTDATSQEPFILKIHGDIDVPESIVITDEDYIQFVLRMGDKDPFHPVPLTFRFHFTKWPTLFIGYSLMDYNLRLLFKTLRWKLDKSKIPDTYSVDLYPDPLILDVWQNQRRYIKFVVQDVWTFIPRLYEKVKGQVMP